MKSGVYHVQQEALADTAKHPKTINPASGRQESKRAIAESPSAAGQSLAADETFWLGQPLKQSGRPPIQDAFRVAPLNLRIFRPVLDIALQHPVLEALLLEHSLGDIEKGNNT